MRAPPANRAPAKRETRPPACVGYAEEPGRSLAMIELAVRLPMSFSTGQTRLLLILVAGLVIALLAGAFVEGTLGGVVAMILRAAGHRPPRKSSFRTALDEMQARLDRKEK